MTEPKTNLNLKQCVKLYKSGKLTEESDLFFIKLGYAINRRNGKVTGIVPVDIAS